ncbi:MAG TPA: VCBS repeat-containing protein, partial [Pyrinomonadaceae bacterium]|nr:VCBS repeat-containing protein [Pyrinomonadaceae bacterium]
MALVLSLVPAAAPQVSRGQESSAPSSAGKESAKSSAPVIAGTAPVVFAEVAPAQSKITWAHDNARSEAHHLPETCGGGGLFFDYDGDGWLDIYFVNSGPSDFFSPKTPLKNALYRNNGDGTFSDVTDKAGVAGNTFGMGAAAADYDGDGRPDLY